MMQVINIGRLPPNILGMILAYYRCDQYTCWVSTLVYKALQALAKSIRPRGLVGPYPQIVNTACKLWFNGAWSMFGQTDVDNRY